MMNFFQGPDIERLEVRPDDAVALAQDPVETGRFSIGENYVDLGMRDAERLHHVLDRRWRAHGLPGVHM